MATGLSRLIIGSDPARTLRRIFVLVVGAYLLVTYGILPVRGSGPSMLPTIRDGEFLVVNRLSFVVRLPRRGEVVAVRLAGGRAVLVKRILAGPGDRLAIDDGAVTVNGVAIDEPYVEDRRAWNLPEVELGGEQYFVVGDNRSMPIELHTMGTVSRPRLVGPVIW